MFRKKYYSRSNVGSRGFDNENLETLADIAIKLLEKGESIENTVKKIEKEINTPGVWVEVEGDMIHICDENLDSNGNSWGFDRITIVQETWWNEIEKMVKAAEKFVDENANYEVVDLDRCDYAIHSVTETVPIVEGEIISGKKVLKIVRAIAEYLELAEPGEAPINSNNPYAWGENKFFYEISADEIDIEIQYVDQWGAAQHLWHEKLYLKRVEV